MSEDIGAAMTPLAVVMSYGSAWDAKNNAEKEPVLWLTNERGQILPAEESRMEGHEFKYERPGKGCKAPSLLA